MFPRKGGGLRYFSFSMKKRWFEEGEDLVDVPPSKRSPRARVDSVARDTGRKALRGGSNGQKGSLRPCPPGSKWDGTAPSGSAPAPQLLGSDSDSSFTEWGDSRTANMTIVVPLAWEDHSLHGVHSLLKTHMWQVLSVLAVYLKNE